MERPTRKVTCSTCGQVWTVTKAGAEDFALMATLCVPSWFKDKTGEERFKARQVREGMPKEATWERALENAVDVGKALDIMTRYAVDPEIVPGDTVLPKTGENQIHRASVGVCCVGCVPSEIFDLTAEEAGLVAGFSDDGSDGEPGPTGATVLNKPARDGGPQGD